MPEMTPERLTEIENWATESLSRGGLGNIDPRVVSGLISEVRRLTAERDAAAARAEAEAQAAATLRGALREAVARLGVVYTYAAVGKCEKCGGYVGTISQRFCGECGREYLLTAVDTPPTTYAKLAEARTAYIAADRMPGGLPDSQEWRAKFDRLHTANAALAEAEREAGVGRS